MIETTPTLGPIFSAEEKESFVTNGYVVAPGLLREDLVRPSREAMIKVMEVDPEDSATFPGKYTMFNPDLLRLTIPLRTAGIEAAARELVGPHTLQGQCYSPYLDQQGIKPVDIGGFIPVFRFPEAGPQEFVAQAGWHLDGMHAVKTWPAKLFLIVFAYLTDVAKFGAPTAVKPGSHRQIFEHCMRTGQEAHTRPPELDYAAPEPIVGQAGDVVFMHYLLVHSGSFNYSNQIRMGLNTGIQPDPAHPYVRKAGAPQPDWTPLDFTLRQDTLPQA